MAVSARGTAATTVASAARSLLTASALQPHTALLEPWRESTRVRPRRRRSNPPRESLRHRYRPGEATLESSRARQVRLTDGANRSGPTRLAAGRGPVSYTHLRAH